MEPAFVRYAESLHPSFERLVAMTPVTVASLPRDAPSACVYLFSEDGRHLYVGRTRNLRQRLRQHSIPSSQHNQAVFAFRLAREATGRLTAEYTGEGRRESSLRGSRTRSTTAPITFFFATREPRRDRSDFGSTTASGVP